MPPLNGLPPIHPGRIFEGHLLPRKNLNLHDAATQLGVTDKLLKDFVDGKVPVTKDLATRLSNFSNTSRKFWTNLQANYDAALARRGATPASAPKP